MDAFCIYWNAKLHTHANTKHPVRQYSDPGENNELMRDSFGREDSFDSCIFGERQREIMSTGKFCFMLNN